MSHDAFLSEDFCWILQWIGPVRGCVGTSVNTIEVLFGEVTWPRGDMDATTGLLGGMVVTRNWRGCMPLDSIGSLTVGSIWRAGRIVGYVPRQRYKMVVTQDDVDHDAHRVHGGNRGLALPALTGVGALSAVEALYSGSRLFVSQQDGCEFLVPRTVISNFFYTPTSRMVETMLLCPWRMEEAFLACDEKAASGYWGDDAFVVVSKLPGLSDYARWFALFLCSDYASSCAHALHTVGCIDQCDIGGIWRPWHISARLPFDGLQHEPLVMWVAGYELPQVMNGMEACAKRVLVVDVLASTWPRKLPHRIYAQSTNRPVAYDIMERKFALDERNHTRDRHWTNLPPERWKEKELFYDDGVFNADERCWISDCPVCPCRLQ